MEEIVETTSGHRGTRCTVGLNTPAIITDGLPLIILLDEEEGKADVKQPDFTEDTNSGARPKRNAEKTVEDQNKMTDRQDPMTPGQSTKSETPLGTRPKIVGARENMGSERQEHLPDGDVPGGSFPATGTIENLLANLNFDSQKYLQNFVIRAFGFNEPCKPIYGIMEYADGHVMGTFAVDEEKEKVVLKDNTGLDLLTATGSLKHPRGRMNIASPSNQQIAVITEDEIRFNSDNTTFTIEDCREQGIFTPFFATATMYYQEKSLVCISAHEDSVKLEMHSRLSNVQFAIALLHALQILYKYLINKRLMPYGILVQKPLDSFEYFNNLPEDLSIVKRLGGLVLRMACRISPDKWFADFLSIPKFYQRIVLILTKSNGRYEFSDTSGVKHFFAMQDKGIISVRNAWTSWPIGRINMNSGECHDRNNVLQMYIFERPRMAHPPIHHRTNTKSYGVLARDKKRHMSSIHSRFYMTSLGFGQEESRVCKVLIIAFAAVIADTEHGINEQTVPKVKKYPS